MKMRSDQIVRGIIVVGLLLVTMMVTSEAGLLGKEETPGERFRKAIEKIRLSCESRKLAPGEVCGAVTNLKPADPLATEEGRFAHSIRIPNPVPEDSGYKPGMTPEQYFEHLCKTEAGEFIYKTVENVEGIYMMRPRERSHRYEFEHLYALEDPYGHTQLGLQLNRLLDSFVQMAIAMWRFLLPERCRPGRSDTEIPHCLPLRVREKRNMRVILDSMLVP
jgi:hypothetical protein